MGLLAVLVVASCKVDLVVDCAVVVLVVASCEVEYLVVDFVVVLAVAVVILVVLP